jgi:branched-chain amino acid transport system substrate-binding protein
VRTRHGLKGSSTIVALVVGSLAISVFGSSTAGASTPKTIKLASILDLTGVASAPSIGGQQGEQAAVTDINKTHYLGGTDLSIVYQDSQSTATQAEALANSDAHAGYVGVLGPMLGNESAVISPITERAGLGLVALYSSGSWITTAGANTYDVTPGQNTYFHKSLQYLQQKGIKTVSIIYNNDDPATALLYQEAETQAAAYGIHILDAEAASETATDLSSYVSKIVGANPKAILVLVTGSQNVVAVTEIKGDGFDGPIVGATGMAGGVLAPLGSKANNIVWATDFSALSSDASTKSFDSTYKKLTGSEPTDFNAQGWDGVWFIAAALKSAENTTSTALEKGLAKVAKKGFDGALGKITFKSRAAVSAGILTQWENGQSVVITP